MEGTRGAVVATTSALRIDDDLYASAKLVGEVMSRSAAQQVAHWARIGRELEASGSVSSADVAEVLRGARSYDSLDARAQAVVRASWTHQMTTLREGLDLAAELAASGQSYSELDDDGAVVTVTPTRQNSSRSPRRRRT